jgi:GNAT superfamily N-acetyltransferase
VAFTRKVFLLWHGEVAVGIIVFSAPAASLTLRSQYFGLQQRRSRLTLQALNEQLWVLQRLVLHPTYRGAGIAAAFVRRACSLCPVDWIETLAAMGQAHPVFERAGFVKVGTVTPPRRRTSRVYSRGRLTAAAQLKSQYSQPVYFILDNRRRDQRLVDVERSTTAPGQGK